MATSPRWSHRAEEMIAEGVPPTIAHELVPRPWLCSWSDMLVIYTGVAMEAMKRNPCLSLSLCPA